MFCRALCASLWPAEPLGPGVLPRGCVCLSVSWADCCILLMLEADPWPHWLKTLPHVVAADVLAGKARPSKLAEKPSCPWLMRANCWAGQGPSMAGFETQWCKSAVRPLAGGVGLQHLISLWSQLPFLYCWYEKNESVSLSAVSDSLLPCRL